MARIHKDTVVHYVTMWSNSMPGSGSQKDGRQATVSSHSRIKANVRNVPFPRCVGLLAACLAQSDITVTLD